LATSPTSQHLQRRVLETTTSPYSLKVNFPGESEQLDVQKCTIGNAKVYNWKCKSVQLDVQKCTIGWAKVYNWKRELLTFICELNRLIFNKSTDGAIQVYESIELCYRNQ